MTRHISQYQREAKVEEEDTLLLFLLLVSKYCVDGDDDTQYLDTKYRQHTCHKPNYV